MKPEWADRSVDNSEVQHAQNLLAQRSKEVRECEVPGCCEGMVPTTRLGADGESHPAVRPCECRRAALAAFHELKQIAGGGFAEYVTHRMSDWTPEKAVCVSDPVRMSELKREGQRILGGIGDLPGEAEDERD